MGTIAASAARMAGAADAGRRLRVISAGVAALAGAVPAARRAWHARRVTAYVVSGGSGVPVVVTPIHTATSTAGQPIPIPLGQSIAITPNGTTAYVPNPEDGTVIPILTATSTAGPPITVGNGPLRIVVTPDGETSTSSTSMMPR